MIYANKIFFFFFLAITKYSPYLSIIMKTQTTSRGIEYDIEVKEYSHNSITITATCEYGDKEFTFYPNIKLGRITEDELDNFLSDLDYTEVEKWVDATVIGELTKRVSEYCVNKSELGRYYSFSIFHFNSLRIAINVMESDRLHINGKLIESVNLEGVEQIEEYIRLWKK